MPNYLVDPTPPNGMKTVMFNNEPVGYVKHTDDPEESAILAKQLLIEKGLWKTISVAEQIFGQATSFANAANHIYEKDLKSPPRNPQGIAPFVVNAAFSAELYLKCLKTTESEPSQTHTLTALHKTLPNKIKDKINKHKATLEAHYKIEQGVLFKEHLKNINNAFVNWRYIFEKEVEHININAVIFVLHVLHQTAIEELGVGA